jgi:Tat protein translocase TatB subunit
MPSIGPLEILVVAVIALIVFGPEKLPDIARTIGRTAAELRRVASDVRDEFELGLDDDEDDEDDEPDPAVASTFSDGPGRSLNHESSTVPDAEGRSPDRGP